jgi:hypothetical protein
MFHIQKVYFVNVGKLKANNGNQNYDIPTETDLTKYDTVLIWCRLKAEVCYSEAGTD